MHKTRYNALRLTVNLSPKGPLLIKAGGVSAHPSLPDMQFVRTHRADGPETVYIPGASLKGVARGFVEQVLRTLDDRTSWRWACATFEAKGKEREDKGKWNCPQFLADLEEQDRKLQPWKVYACSCGACRIFGHTRLRGRVALTDFFPVEEMVTEIRYGVAISRLSHAVAQGPFEMEVAVAGTFQGHLVLENFEIWQLGLLALALESMNQGLVKVGFGKNRGFGEVSIKVEEAQLEEKPPLAEPTTLRGLAAFVEPEEQAKYGLAQPMSLGGLPQPGQRSDLGLYVRRTYDAEGWTAIANQAMKVLSAG
ncbi:MAG: RAMP superfamily CRISPR-associated protein [Anaerolineae bacterium]